MNRSDVFPGVEIFGLGLGGNPFGWTLNARESEQILDAYVEAGGNLIDTADIYSKVPGTPGGDSEIIIGNWLRGRSDRDELIIGTKVGVDGGISAANVRAKAENCLRRLQVERIDLLYVHLDDGETPVEETLEALDELVKAGKVRRIGACNYSPDRLRAALDASAREGFEGFVVAQFEYNLMEREAYERDVAPIVAEYGLLSVPFWGLARGFLSGKYRPGVDFTSPQETIKSVKAYLDERGLRVLAELDAIAAAHGTKVAAVALAWLRRQPGVVAPLAGARSVDQLAESLASVDVVLTDEEAQRLDVASGLLEATS